MVRRVYLSALRTGSIALEPAEAHHIRDVLRLEAGAALELFDDTGQTAAGIIRHVNGANVVVDVESVIPRAINKVSLTVAAAIPKGDRADWMIEKLTELGVNHFIPLAAERSVVLPGGKNKVERWERIVIESTKQSRRVGIMTIGPLTELKTHIGKTDSEKIDGGWYLSTAENAQPVQAAISTLKRDMNVLIGPEGGWAPAEVDLLNRAGLTGVALTTSILRVETAAITVAALILCFKATH